MMKILLMLFIFKYAASNGHKSLSHSDSSRLRNIMTEDFKVDPVRDMKISMLKVQIDHAPSEEYYALVLKANAAVEKGYITRNYETKKKGARGMYTELYNVVEDGDKVLLPSVCDLQAARGYFKVGNEEDEGEQSEDENDVQEDLQEEGELTRKEYHSHTNKNNYQGERFTEDEKEDILERMIEQQDRERTRPLKKQKSKRHQKSDS